MEAARDLKKIVVRIDQESLIPSLVEVAGTMVGPVV